MRARCGREDVTLVTGVAIEPLVDIELIVPDEFHSKYANEKNENAANR